MAAVSAGLLMYTKEKSQLQVLLVHPGGPFFTKKDAGWWTIPKGLPNENEELIDTAIREFKEEVGVAPFPPYFYLDSIKQKGGKQVHCWAFETKSCNNPTLMSNTFELEWPPKSGIVATFPEVDKAEWMPIFKAKEYIMEAQLPFLERLEKWQSQP